MSVEKMNAYKEQKAHRKENLAKEKRKKKATRVAWYAAGAAVVVAICAAVGLTGWNSYQRYLDSLPDYNVTSQVITDYAGVLEDEDLEEEELPEEEAVDAEEAEEAVTEAAEEAEEAVTEAAEEAEEAVTEAAE